MHHLAVSLDSPVHPNQDRWGVHGTLGWVVDGATRLPSAESDRVIAYVEGLGAAFAALVDQHPSASLPALLEAAIERASRELGPGDFDPSATVAMARADDEGVEWLVLCDAAIRWRTPDGTEGFETDTTLAEVASRLPREGFGEAIEALRNVPGGFWCAQHRPEAARHARRGRLPHGSEVVLMSDGVGDHASGLEWGRLTGEPDATVRRLRADLVDRGVVPDDMTALHLAWDVVAPDQAPEMVTAR